MKGCRKSSVKENRGKSFGMGILYTVLAATIFFTVGTNAWGGSANISVAVNADGSVVAKIDGNFDSCAFCDVYYPDGTCAKPFTTNDGQVYLFKDGVQYCWQAWYGTASCTYTFDRGELNGTQSVDPGGRAAAVVAEIHDRELGEGLQDRQAWHYRADV